MQQRREMSGSSASGHVVAASNNVRLETGRMKLEGFGTLCRPQ
jgi:hypothetical protein